MVILLCFEVYQPALRGLRIPAFLLPHFVCCKDVVLHPNFPRCPPLLRIAVHESRQIDFQPMACGSAKGAPRELRLHLANPGTQRVLIKPSQKGFDLAECPALQIANDWRRDVEQPGRSWGSGTDDAKL